MDQLSPNPSNSSTSSHLQETFQPSEKHTDPVKRQKQPKSIEPPSLFQGENELKQYLEALASIPDVRKDRIASIQAALQQGNYSICAEELADALIRDLSTQPPKSSSSST